ncbi:MAG: tRNA (adenosine(37)-N6)-threonylcarbamoyltransferase complex dimerization subunit type 1 TsaB [Ferruginibacter sp.]
MPFILNIDTATENASVSLAENGSITAFTENNIQKDHATFLHLAIKDLLHKTGIGFKQLSAIAVTEGPGSYTGLRVGMASAKGLCYALNKPFITINTLEAMALASIQNSLGSGNLYCPMIDARRMEVYTALYKKDMENILPSSAIILTEKFLEDELKKNKIVFSGSGVEKWKIMSNSPNCMFLEQSNIYLSIAQLSYKKSIEKEFTELAHSQPLYVKEFYNG